jgi:hypothetical protein
MLKISIKVLAFLMPLIIINQLILHTGFLFSTKNDYILCRNLQDSKPGKVNIKVFGSSRIEIGISPSMMEQGYKSKGVDVEVYNCGKNGRYPGWGLKMQEKFGSRCDIIIIEIIPEKNLMIGAYDLPSKQTWAMVFDQFLSFHLNHYFVIHHLPNLVSELRGRLPIKYMYTHPDGWTEAEYFMDTKRLNPLRDKIDSWALQALKDKGYLSGFDEFVLAVKEVQQRTGSQLVFLRMPVNGRIKVLNDQMLIESDIESKLHCISQCNLYRCESNSNIIQVCRRR